MPVRNAEKHIADQLRALSVQTYDGGWEVVVADNGCTDRSIDIVGGFGDSLPALTIVDASAREGINHARNVGAACARGDFLVFCDADDVVTPGWLAAMARAAPHGDLVGGALDFEALNDATARALCPWQPPRGLPRACHFMPYAPGGNCGVWSEVARRLRWDEAFVFGSSDMEFSWRAQLASYGVHFAPDAVLQQRLKPRLRDLARQYYAYGKADPLLHRRFRDLGMAPPHESDAFRTRARLILRSRDLFGSLEARAQWVRTAARKCGRLVGGLRNAALLRASQDGVALWNGAGGRQRNRAIHLLEVGLHWPPEPYLQEKLKRLADEGMRVTVASTVPRHKAGNGLPGVELERVPSWREPRALKLAGLTRDALSLLLRDPARLRTLVSAVRHHPAPSHPRSGWRSAVAVLRPFLRLAHLRPDVVHFEWTTAAMHHLPLTEVWACPVVISCHGHPGMHTHLPDKERWSAGLAPAFARAAAVHCVCDDIRRESLRHGADPAKTWLIRPAVDTTFFRPPVTRRREDAPLRVLSVGRLHWVKGYEYALQAIRLLVEGEVPVRLRIVGEGPDRDRIVAAIDDLGLDGRVALAGHVTPTEVRAHLHEGDVLVAPSVSDGIPHSVLEAMACAVPVVVSDCGGVREAVTDGREGIVVPPRDSPAMAAALATLWRDPGLATRMGAAGRTRVESDFALSGQVPRFLELYERVSGVHAEEC